MVICQYPRSIQPLLMSSIYMYLQKYANKVLICTVLYMYLYVEISQKLKWLESTKLAKPHEQ